MQCPRPRKQCTRCSRYTAAPASNTPPSLIMCTWSRQQRKSRLVLRSLTAMILFWNPKRWRNCPSNRSSSRIRRPWWKATPREVDSTSRRILLRVRLFTSASTASSKMQRRPSEPTPRTGLQTRRARVTWRSKSIARMLKKKCRPLNKSQAALVHLPAKRSTCWTTRITRFQMRPPKVVSSLEALPLSQRILKCPSRSSKRCPSRRQASSTRKQPKKNWRTLSLASSRTICPRRPPRTGHHRTSTITLKCSDSPTMASIFNRTLTRPRAARTYCSRGTSATTTSANRTPRSRRSKRPRIIQQGTHSTKTNCSISSKSSRRLSTFSGRPLRGWRRTWPGSGANWMCKRTQMSTYRTSKSTALVLRVSTRVVLDSEAARKQRMFWPSRISVRLSARSSCEASTSTRGYKLLESTSDSSSPKSRCSKTKETRKSRQ